jgi:hypothetical protein
MVIDLHGHAYLRLAKTDFEKITYKIKDGVTFGRIIDDEQRHRCNFARETQQPYCITRTDRTVDVSFIYFNVF